MGKIGAGIGVAVVFLLFAVPLAIYADGKDSTHTRDIDFSVYMSYLAIPTIVIAVTLGVSGPVYMSAKKGNTGGAKWMIGIAAVAALVISIWFVQVGRSWMDNAKTAEIEVVQGTSGDFEIQSAQLEDYRTLDRGPLYDTLRILTRESKYKMAFDLKTLETDPMYNGTVATLQGYNIERDPVTGLLAPKTQPGDLRSDEQELLVFEGVERQDASPDDLIIFYNLTLWDDDQENILGSWIVHTDPQFNEWALDTTA